MLPIVHFTKLGQFGLGACVLFVFIAVVLFVFKSPASIINFKAHLSYSLLNFLSKHVLFTFTSLFTLCTLIFKKKLSAWMIYAWMYSWKTKLYFAKVPVYYHFHVAYYFNLFQFLVYYSYRKHTKQTDFPVEFWTHK